MENFLAAIFLLCSMVFLVALLIGWRVYYNPGILRPAIEMHGIMLLLLFVSYYRSDASSFLGYLNRNSSNLTAVDIKGVLALFPLAVLEGVFAGNALKYVITAYQNKGASQ